MSESSRDFDEFMKQREEASNAFVNGDFNPLDQISARSLSATIFGPKGDCVRGAEHVNAQTPKAPSSSSRAARTLLRYYTRR